ncbi:hypothetical protein PPL_11034 [Heterostelium album PN500]|uniref:Uncharacterized protein n=1 Tax=Heterostelium pallidum (strain ATCC 26659 / Pp 5 / PN500) TaxID=670386 RepID=D3BSR5_HETP5|nr:hypothetical protein PPL_11034 [Heterostelium album PN500]EFA75530.1 hypothetical protein PPL_11034 [Heterostelium album PN500]|eukprot:XP_020427664.1 hypothetical protein PPL_11034 [Heterostelium album PN500]
MNIFGMKKISILPIRDIPIINQVVNFVRINAVISKLRSTEPTYHFKHITQLAQLRSQEERFEKKRGIFEIDYDYVYFTLLDAQKRRCPITNVPLSLVSMSHWQASVDRADDKISIKDQIMNKFNT